MAEIEIVENWAYYSLVSDLIRQAQNSIEIVMFDFLLPQKASNSPTQQLVEKMIAARERGVRVKVLLNASPHYPHLSEIHSALADMLRKKLIDVREWNREETLHAKMVIIDRLEVVIGSHNISDAALKKNEEISVRVSNSRFGEKCSQVFDRLWCAEWAENKKGECN